MQYFFEICPTSNYPCHNSKHCQVFRIWIWRIWIWWQISERDWSQSTSGLSCNWCRCHFFPKRNYSNQPHDILFLQSKLNLNNAGFLGDKKPLENYNIDVWKKVFDINPIKESSGKCCVVGYLLFNQKYISILLIIATHNLISHAWMPYTTCTGSEQSLALGAAIPNIVA